jgi:hypothetical protein
MKNKFKNLCLFLAFIITSTITFAQNGNSTFEIFSENGDPFIIIMNGLQQNAQPQTNVKIQNLTSAAYKIRVIFQNTELGALNDKINLDYSFHQSYVIKLKKISNFQKSLKLASTDLAENLTITGAAEADAKRAEIENENSKYVIKMLSKVPIYSAPVSTNNYNNYQQTPQNSVTNQSNMNNSGATQQATVVQQSTTTSGNNASINSNMGGANVSMNISLNGNQNTNTSYSQTTTTTHTTSGGQIPVQQNVYVMPGYSGPTGCPWPMSEGDFANAKNSIQSKSFEDSKLTMAKQIFDHNCLLSSQVRDIMSIFDFEATRLEFAKYAYGRTYDIGNYYKVNDVFDFESSISDLNGYINNYKR